MEFIDFMWAKLIVLCIAAFIYGYIMASKK